MSTTKRPEYLNGPTYKMKTGCGSVYVTINFSEKDTPVEVLVTMGKAGGCASAQNEVTGRLVSLNLKAGFSVKKVLDQLKGVRCHTGTVTSFLSCADAIGHALERAVEERKPKDDGTDSVRNNEETI